MSDDREDSGVKRGEMATKPLVPVSEIPRNSKAAEFVRLAAEQLLVLTGQISKAASCLKDPDEALPKLLEIQRGVNEVKLLLQVTKIPAQELDHLDGDASCVFRAYEKMDDVLVEISDLSLNLEYPFKRTAFLLEAQRLVNEAIVLLQETGIPKIREEAIFENGLSFRQFAGEDAGLFTGMATPG